MTDPTVAKEIMVQLGRGTLFMLGAQNLVYSDNTLSFKIRGSKAFTHIRIELNAMDTYDVIFMRSRAGVMKAEDKNTVVYADGLHQLIEEKTGLYTRIPNVIYK